MRPEYFIEKKVYNPIISETVIHAIPFYESFGYSSMSLHYHMESSSIILSVYEDFREVKIIIENKVVNTKQAEFSPIQLDEYEYDKCLHLFFKIDSVAFKEICESETAEIWLYKKDRVWKRFSIDKKCNFIQYFRAFFNLTIDSSKYVDAIDKLKLKDKCYCISK